MKTVERPDSVIRYGFREDFKDMYQALKDKNYSLLEEIAGSDGETYNRLVTTRECGSSRLYSADSQ